MPTIAKQSYKQNYTDNVELSIFNCGHEYCQPGHTWGPGVRDHYLIHLVVAGKGVYQVNGAAYNLQEGDLFLAKPNQLITYAMKPTRGNITGSALTVPAPTSWCSRPRSAMCSPCTTAKIPKAPVKPFIISTWPAARNRSAKP